MLFRNTVSDVHYIEIVVWLSAALLPISYRILSRQWITASCRRIPLYHKARLKYELDILDGFYSFKVICLLHWDLAGKGQGVTAFGCVQAQTLELADYKLRPQAAHPCIQKDAKNNQCQSMCSLGLSSFPDCRFRADVDSLLDLLSKPGLMLMTPNLTQ